MSYTKGILRRCNEPNLVEDQIGQIQSIFFGS